jgi:hypothetical protein
MPVSILSAAGPSIGRSADAVTAATRRGREHALASVTGYASASRMRVGESPAPVEVTAFATQGPLISARVHDDALLSASNLAPGDRKTGLVDVAIDGGAPVSLWLTRSALVDSDSTHFASALPRGWRRGLTINS